MALSDARVVVPGIRVTLCGRTIMLFFFALLVGTALSSAGQEYDEISLISGQGLFTHAEAAKRAQEGQEDLELPQENTDSMSEELRLISGQISERQLAMKVVPKITASDGQTDSSVPKTSYTGADTWIDVVDAKEDKPVQQTFLQRFGEFVANKLHVHAPSSTVPKNCQGAPSMITALLLQIFLGQFGAGFMYMARWDYAGMCLGILFAPCLLCCLGCFFQKFCGSEGSSPLVVTIVTLAGCAGCATFAVQLWSIIMIANYSITCGGDYSGCDLSH